MIEVLRVNQMVLTIGSDVLQLLVAAERFSHIKCILTSLSSCRIIAVVPMNSPKHGVPVDARPGI